MAGVKLSLDSSSPTESRRTGTRDASPEIARVNWSISLGPNVLLDNTISFRSISNPCAMYRYSHPAGVVQASRRAHHAKMKKASEGSRTLNPRITNAVLCQLKLRWHPAAHRDRLRNPYVEKRPRCVNSRHPMPQRRGTRGSSRRAVWWKARHRWHSDGQSVIPIARIAVPTRSARRPPHTWPALKEMQGL